MSRRKKSFPLQHQQKKGGEMPLNSSIFRSDANECLCVPRSLSINPHINTAVKCSSSDLRNKFALFQHSNYDNRAFALSNVENDFSSPWPANCCSLILQTKKKPLLTIFSLLRPPEKHSEMDDKATTLITQCFFIGLCLRTFYSIDVECRWSSPREQINVKSEILDYFSGFLRMFTRSSDAHIRTTSLAEGSKTNVERYQ